MTRGFTHVVGVLCFCLIAACSINHRSGEFLCEKQSDCTGDRTCSNGVCVANGTPADGPGDPPDTGPEPFKCPAQCTSCVESTKTCRVDCMAAGGVVCAQPITCPAGFNCVILCSRNSVNGNGQCQGKIDCQDAASCDVTCSGTNTCKAIVCGEGPCDVTCSGFGSCAQVDCDASCQCDVECGPGSNCQNLSCPGLAGQCNTIGKLGCDSNRGDACHTCP